MRERHTRLKMIRKSSYRFYQLNDTQFRVIGKEKNDQTHFTSYSRCVLFSIVLFSAFCHDGAQLLQMWLEVMAFERMFIRYFDLYID